MDEPAHSNQKTNVPVMEPLAQFADTYILAQGGDELFIIDQHALHERIRYERLRNEMTSWEAQNLISPLELELSPSQIQIVEGYRELLKKLGLEFDEEARRLLSVPRLLIGDGRLQGFIRDLLTDLSTTEGMMLDSVERLQDDIAFMRSCRGAVKANQRLEIAEMRRLLADMGTIHNPWACVHGRPTVLRIGINEMDDHFGRLG
jgi:DNA mismatch repair protein MutL